MDSVARKRRSTIGGIAASTAVVAAIWWALYHYLPAPAGAGGSLTTAVACCAVAALLTLVAGVEAVAHERLVTEAIDPLEGFVTRRLLVNFRYLSNTVEQYLAFAAGLLALAAYTGPRILIIVTIIWVVTRWAFWVGYHRSSLARAVGAPGMVQSMLVLLYVVYRFAADSYGTAAGMITVGLFGAIEGVLFWSVLRHPQSAA